jgi:hypothetical protein
VTTVGLARLQFASTSIYHFLYVPLTIGLAFLTALLQTSWHRNGRPEYLRLTRFFGTLLVINVAVGVVTGLVQEFQFGMNWSVYSRFVGDVFGAPPAMEGLAAFFLESTFLGLWLFGWNRLPRRIHLATIWLVAVGSALSAALVMAANSWMQHPVGFTVNPANGRAQLTSIWAVLTNPVFLWGFLHVLLAAAVTGGMVMLAVSAWHLLRGRSANLFAGSARLSLVVLIPASVLILFVGQRLRAVHRRHLRGPQPAARRQLPGDEDRWRSARPLDPDRPRDLRAGDRGGGQLRDLDPRDRREGLPPFGAGDRRDAGGHRRHLAGRRGQGRLGVRRHRVHHGRGGRVAVRRPLPAGDGLDPAGSPDLTVRTTSSASYSLTVMTVIALVLLPVVIAYQAWSFHVFRRRLGRAGGGAPAAPGDRGGDGDRPATEPVRATPRSDNREEAR